MDINQLKQRIISEFRLGEITNDAERQDVGQRIINVLSGRIADTLMGKLPDEQIGQLEDLINKGLTHEDLLKYFQTLETFHQIIESEIEKLKGEIMV